MSFPRVLNYSSQKPGSAPGRPEILRFKSDNSSYSQSSTIRIEIPTGRQGMHLFPQSSYIEGQLVVNASATDKTGLLHMDQSIYSVVHRMRVLHGSQVLEDILYPNRLWNAVYDIQKNTSERTGDSNSLLVDWDVGTIGEQLVSSVLNTDTTPVPLFASTGTNTKVYNFCWVLPSGLLGSLASKALPLGLCGASSIYIELELESASIPFYGTGTTTAVNSYTLSNIYYNAKVVMLPGDVENALIQSNGGEIMLSAVSYKGEMKTMSAASAFNDKFSFQYSSLKNFLFFFTNSATANGGITKRCICSRPACGLSEWNLMINGEAFPSQTINSYSKMYFELMRAYHSLTDTNAGGILGAINYGCGTGHTANDTITHHRFVAGVDLDRFDHSSDTLLSGTSTIGQMVNLNLVFSSTTPEALNIYGFVMYDVLFILSNGLLSAKS
jgi:hypothetical protein